MPKKRGQKSPRATDKQVGRRVRMARMMLKLSQTELGKAIGLTFQQVQKYEKGVNRVGASRLDQIAKVLKVPVSFFFDEPIGPGDGKKSPDYVSEFLITTEGLALAEAFTPIKETEVRRNIVKLVQAIADEQD